MPATHRESADGAGTPAQRSGLYATISDLSKGDTTVCNGGFPPQHEGRTFRLGERVRVELSSETAVLVPETAAQAR